MLADRLVISSQVLPANVVWIAGAADDGQQRLLPHVDLHHPYLPFLEAFELDLTDAEADDVWVVQAHDRARWMQQRRSI